MSDQRSRELSQCLVMKDTHEPLVDRKTWELAQQKLADERERTSHAPRNPAYYLKQIFVCGHCGKSMAARTETDPNGHRKVVYVCSTYLKGRQNGHPVPCGYHRITHEDAEQLLMDKIKKLNLPLDKGASDGARVNLQERLARLGHEDEESVRQWEVWVQEGINDLADYFNEAYQPDYKVLQRLRKLALRVYCDEKIEDQDFTRLPLALREFNKALREAEQQAVRQAKNKVDEIREEHRSLTLSWARATDDMQTVLKQEIENLEAQRREWEARTLPIIERLNRLYTAEEERQAERQQLLAEWPKLEDREKGEALRRLFRTVSLYWNQDFHPCIPNPSRPRKTDRPGRYSYTLQGDRTEWRFTVTDSVSSW